MQDIINHPSHYADQGVVIEPIELTSRLPHPLASAYEYAIRAGKKEGSPELVDLKKARFWLNFYLDQGIWSEPDFTDRSLVFFLLHTFAQRHEIAKVMLDEIERKTSELLEFARKPMCERVPLAMLAYVEERIARIEGANHEKA